eukprot:403368331
MKTNRSFGSLTQRNSVTFDFESPHRRIGGGHTRNTIGYQSNSTLYNYQSLSNLQNYNTQGKMPLAGTSSPKILIENPNSQNLEQNVLENPKYLQMIIQQSSFFKQKQQKIQEQLSRNEKQDVLTPYSPSKDPLAKIQTRENLRDDDRDSQQYTKFTSDAVLLEEESSKINSNFNLRDKRKSEIMIELPRQCFHQGMKSHDESTYSRNGKDPNESYLKNYEVQSYSRPLSQQESPDLYPRRYSKLNLYTKPRSQRSPSQNKIDTSVKIDIFSQQFDDTHSIKLDMTKCQNIEGNQDQTKVEMEEMFTVQNITVQERKFNQLETIDSIDQESSKLDPKNCSPGNVQEEKTFDEMLSQRQMEHLSMIKVQKKEDQEEQNLIKESKPQQKTQSSKSPKKFQKSQTLKIWMSQTDTNTVQSNSQQISQVVSPKNSTNNQVNTRLYKQAKFQKPMVQSHIDQVPKLKISSNSTKISLFSPRMSVHSHLTNNASQTFTISSKQSNTEQSTDQSVKKDTKVDKNLEKKKPWSPASKTLKSSPKFKSQLQKDKQNEKSQINETRQSQPFLKKRQSIARQNQVQISKSRNSIHESQSTKQIIENRKSIVSPLKQQNSQRDIKKPQKPSPRPHYVNTNQKRNIINTNIQNSINPLTHQMIQDNQIYSDLQTKEQVQSQFIKANENQETEKIQVISDNVQKQIEWLDSEIQMVKEQSQNQEVQAKQLEDQLDALNQIDHQQLQQNCRENLYTWKTQQYNDIQVLKQDLEQQKEKLQLDKLQNSKYYESLIETQERFQKDTQEIEVHFNVIKSRNDELDIRMSEKFDCSKQTEDQSTQIIQQKIDVSVETESPTQDMRVQQRFLFTQSVIDQFENQNQDQQQQPGQTSQKYFSLKQSKRVSFSDDALQIPLDLENQIKISAIQSELKHLIKDLNDINQLEQIYNSQLKNQELQSVKKQKNQQYMNEQSSPDSTPIVTANQLFQLQDDDYIDNEIITQPVHNDQIEYPEDLNYKELYDDYEMKFPSEYHNVSSLEKAEQDILFSRMDDDKIVIKYQTGKEEIIFNNGVKKEIWPDGYEIIFFNNNDIKQVYPGKFKIVYFYQDANITETQYEAMGISIYRFKDKIQKIHFDGKVETFYPDGKLVTEFQNSDEALKE